MFTKNYIISLDARPSHQKNGSGRITSVFIDEILKNGKKKTVYANVRYSNDRGDDTIKQLVIKNTRGAA